ncbi:pentose kinase [Alginatibacterium sediminis]|uniref:Pentose kinase n=1 Tax=Alginatibacterium sediminis TaxID=2164068 RepID=A0A420EDP2_9ALTE|nr:FGGY family carbohydrate kinase [Alginatibacterium sediminis]RKF18786.1 pentose kinase [Alginatibacterium sediminis]
MNAVILALDIGTGSARAALVEHNGTIQALVQQEYDQNTPRQGWSEQQPKLWWDSICSCISQLKLLHSEIFSRIEVIASCGQMHAPVLLDSNGQLLNEYAQLWNDKRCQQQVSKFKGSNDWQSLLSKTANPPTTAWPAFKLKWIQEHETQLWANTAKVLMPKDYINFCLCGEIATDHSEASCFYLMDAYSQQWDLELLELFSIKAQQLPPIVESHTIIGYTQAAVTHTGLPIGIPVIAGAADMVATLIGSGVCSPGQASDSTGTSTLLTVLGSQANTANPLLNNVLINQHVWGNFSILDAGGDAMRWARLAFHDNQKSYQEMLTTARDSALGSSQLMFLPYLSGERTNAASRSRAQFFGLSRNHRAADLYRSILEGVAMAAQRNLQLMRKQDHSPVTQVIASGGGAKDRFWLEIKASIYDLPIVKPECEENGILGCCILGALAINKYYSLQEACARVVHYSEQVLPDPKMRDYYAHAQVLFDQLYTQSQQHYLSLDKLAVLASSTQKTS